MKRMILILLALTLVSGGALAQDYNSFTVDTSNLGFFDSFAWDGLYVYWLHTPDDGSWADPPANLYRMIPGGAEAQLLLEGREDLYIYDLMNIGDSLLLSVADEGGGETRPALINFDGGGYTLLPGSIGSVVLGGGVLYNSVEDGIYEIPLDTMKPKMIWPQTFKEALRLVQYADGKLYLVSEEEAYMWYELKPGSNKMKKIAQVRGNGFVLDGMFYISDYDKLDGTWKYDISTGNRVKVSDSIYDFEQGYGSFVRATGDDADSWFQGAIFDFSKLEDDLEAVKVGECDENYEFIVNGKLLRYDWQKNRVDWSDTKIPGLNG